MFSVQRSAFIALPGLDVDLVALDKGDLGKAAGAALGRAGDQVGDAPVSYTHLDVYKRQVQVHRVAHHVGDDDVVLGHTQGKVGDPYDDP